MKKSKLIKAVSLAAALTLLCGSLAGCSSSSGSETTAAETTAAAGTESAGSTEEAASAEGEVRTIKIGIGNSYNPFCYLDANEELAGYEYEVLKVVDEKLPQYTFEYEPTGFSNILVGLDTDAYDMGVHTFGWNEERAAKYLYAEEPSTTTGGYVILAAEGKDYETLADLAGKKIQVKNSSNVANLLEAYNEANPDAQVEIVYEDSENEQIVSNLVNGVYDAYINEKVDADQWIVQFDGIAEYGDHVLTDGVNSGCYYLYNYGDEQLQSDIDAVLKELREDGTLSELSIEYLGADYSQG